MLLCCGSARGKLEAIDYRYFKRYVVNLQPLRVSGRHGNLRAQGSHWVCRNTWNMPVTCRCFPTQDHCHYQGYVEGILDSVVALSTCSGLRQQNSSFVLQLSREAHGSLNLKKKILSLFLTTVQPDGNSWTGAELQQRVSLCSLSAVSFVQVEVTDISTSFKYKLMQFGISTESHLLTQILPYLI